MRHNRLLSLLLIAAVLTASPAAGQWAKAFKSDIYENNSDLEKVAAPLLQARRMLRDGQSRAEVQSAVPSVPFVDEQPEIEIQFKSLTPETVEQIKKIGMNVTGVYYQYARIVGTCDPSLLDQISAISEVRVVTPNYRPQTNAGSVTDQADAAMRASNARSQYGVDGTGVPVGVISDSFKTLTGGSISGAGCSRTVSGTASQVSGDLPATVTLLQDTQGADEGRAMAELVHDLAPGAPLLFATGFLGEAAFAGAIDQLRTCGAKVIVDDLIYYKEPMFQDGIIAQAAQRAVDAGVPYYSSAGNNATFGVDDLFTDFAPVDPDDNVHRFANGDDIATFVVLPGCTPKLVLQWAEPYDGSLGAGATSDFDLLVYACDESSCTYREDLSSIDAQGCGRQSDGGNPVEFVSLPAAPVPLLYAVAVSRYCGSTQRFRLGLLGNGCFSNSTVDTSIFNEATLYGHSAAKGVAAVAAVDYREINSGGAFQSPGSRLDVEPFSSLGGNLPIFFNTSGVALPGGPQLRAKPEIAAADNTNTTFFGTDKEGDGRPNFSGTSAAAPHAAAVAALIRQRNPALSPAGVLNALTSTATDIQSPSFDFLSGYGLIDALAAVGAAGGSTPTQGSLENPSGNSFQSGISLISGWVCSANRVTYRIDNGEEKDAAYGTSRNDTVAICGDANNGFGALINWNLLGNGSHTIRAYADGVEFGSATFSVTTLGVTFLRGASGQYQLANFPSSGKSVQLRWQEGSQNFVISGVGGGTGSQASVRYANDLVCNSTGFTSTLSANGYTWSAFTGAVSPYQLVNGRSSLGPFIESNNTPCGELSYPFTLPIASGRAYTLTQTFFNGGPFLGIDDDGALQVASAEQAEVPMVPSALYGSGGITSLSFGEALGAVSGSLENPGAASFQSGVGVISGWVCSAGQVTLTIDGGAPFPAAYGTSRTDTVSICGDANNGFGRLINWNLLGSGSHTVRAFADGMQFGEATFTVTTLGSNFLTGASGQYVLSDFSGKDVTVRWQEGQQNFVIVGTSGSGSVSRAFLDEPANLFD